MFQTITEPASSVSRSPKRIT